MSKDPNPADAFKLMHAENKRLGVIETTPDQAASEREKVDIADMTPEEQKIETFNRVMWELARLPKDDQDAIIRSIAVFFGVIVL